MLFSWQGPSLSDEAPSCLATIYPLVILWSATWSWPIRNTPLGPPRNGKLYELVNGRPVRRKVSHERCAGRFSLASAVRFHDSSSLVGVLSS